MGAYLIRALINKKQNLSWVLIREGALIEASALTHVIMVTSDLICFVLVKKYYVTKVFSAHNHYKENFGLGLQEGNVSCKCDHFI